jgi:hypothetical protein
LFWNPQLDNIVIIISFFLPRIQNTLILMPSQQTSLMLDQVDLLYYWTPYINLVMKTWWRSTLCWYLYNCLSVVELA